MTNGRWRLDLPQAGGLTDEERRVLKRWADTLPFAFTEPPLRYTPTWRAGGVAITVGNGSCTGLAARVGPIVLCHIDALAGSTTNLNGGAGVLTWTIPPTLPFADYNPFTQIMPLAGAGIVMEYGAAWTGWNVYRDIASDNVAMIHGGGAPNQIVSTGYPINVADSNAWSMTFAYFTTLGITDR